MHVAFSPHVFSCLPVWQERQHLSAQLAQARSSPSAGAGAGGSRGSGEAGAHGSTELELTKQAQRAQTLQSNVGLLQRGVDDRERYISLLFKRVEAAQADLEKEKIMSAAAKESAKVGCLC